MAPIPTPLTWRRRSFAVFQPDYMLRRLYAVTVSGLVAGPFAVYQSSRNWFTLVHLPSQARLTLRTLPMISAKWHLLGRRPSHEGKASLVVGPDGGKIQVLELQL